MKYTKILLSGKRNTGKTTTFWMLQKELGWPMFSESQYLRDYHRLHGIQGADKETMAEHEPLMVQANDVRLSRLLVSPDRAIIEIRAFEKIRQDWPDVLKVLLICDDEIRVKRNAFRESISEDKSKQRLLKKEEDWIVKMNQQFGFDDYYDKKYY